MRNLAEKVQAINAKNYTSNHEHDACISMIVL